MNRLQVSITGVWLAFFVAACNSSTFTETTPDGTGGFGAANVGGSQAGTVGGNGSVGPGTGGSRTGSVGGSSPGTAGGSKSTSATTSGGNASTGTSSSGGNSTVTGTTNTGGYSSTGTPGTGGTSNTVATAAAGGSSAVGSTNSGTGGGAAVGGAGGASTGGASTGGAPTGGASTGGASTGGASAGGTTSETPEPKLVTSAQNAYWKEGTVTEVTSGNADVTINDNSAQQTWDGFGGTFNEVGWNVLSMLSASERDRAIKLLFDAVEGARFSYGRIPIGASDYALERYTLNESVNDFEMANFSIARDKEKLIPYIKAALAVKSDVHLWASPWTPPTWMKDNGAMDGGNMKDNAQILQANALYLAKFVEEYGKEGLKIEAIHPQNEPGYETRYPSCLWTAALMTKFIRDYLGPTFADRGVDAQIYLGTMSNADAGKDGTIISTVTADSGAMKYVKGFGLQWNMIDSVSSLKSRNLPIIQTEHKCGNYPWQTDTFNPNTAPNDYAYAVESWGLITSWVKAGVNSYSAWNMVLDSAGKNLDPQRPWPQNALLTVNTSAKTLTVTPTYYVFRHVSQFVDPGAKVVGTSGGDALGFKNPDGTIVAVVYNSGSARKSIISIGGKRLQFDMPANGWATVNWK